ncbi:MAG: hypothetical protein ABSH34_17275 [Verrucomicrobiota bacterium]|jgi:hypothetical protein
MKLKTAFLLLGVIPMLASCASPPVALAPVGPGPLADRSPGIGTGRLQVFSSLAEQNDDQNQGGSGASPIWYQDTDYNIYDASGKLVEHVDNTVGHYSTSPRLVSLPPGKYTVRARDKEWLSVNVPVVIERGRTTKVHLDDNWQPPPNTPKTEVVSAPDGNPVGWRAGLPSKP